MPYDQDCITNELAYHLIAQHLEFLNDITSMAAQMTGAMASFISLPSLEEPCIISPYGIETETASMLCGIYTAAEEKNLEQIFISDGVEDQQFRWPNLSNRESDHFCYLSIPLFKQDGEPIGSLYLINDKEKTITGEQVGLLVKLSKQIVYLISLTNKQFETDDKSRLLESRNQILEVIQEINQIGTWELDFKSGKTTWSEMVYKIYEVPLDFDHNKTSAIEFYQTDYQRVILDAIEDAVTNHTCFDVTCRLISAKGTLKWVRSTGKRVAEKLVGSFQDITDLKQGELKFEGIFNSTLSFIGLLNKDGVLLEANETAVKVGGIERADVIGKYFWDCSWWQISEKTRASMKANFFKALSGEKIVYEVDINIANHQTTTILFSLRPVFDDQGQVIYVIPEGMPIDDLVETRDRFKAVLEGTNAGTWEWNIQKGETVYNERWAEFLGYKLSELEPTNDQTWVNLVHPEDVAKSVQKLQLCFDRTEEFYEVESRLKHKNGDWIWILSRGKVTEWTSEGKPLMMYGTHQNITARKNQERELEYQKQLLDALYKLSPIGIALNDYETGKFIDVNDTLLKPTGYTKEEFLNLTYWEVTPREFDPLEVDILRQMENKRRYSSFEKEYIRKDGSRYPVALNGVVVEDLHGKKLIWSFISDITVEKETQRKLNDAIVYLKAILNASAQVGIIATDVNGTITLFNSGAEQMLDYQAEELVGLQTPAVIHLEDEMVAVGSELSKCFGKEIKGFDTFVYEAKIGRPVTKEWTYINKGGHRIPVLLSVNAVMHDREITGFLGVATDISPLKKVEQEIKSLLEITQEQNSRLKNFAHIVSHNLRSHVAGITGLITLIETELPEIADNDLIALLGKGADNLEQTVKDLTEVVKANLTESVNTPINLYEIVQKNIDTLTSQAKNAGILIDNLLDPKMLISGVAAYIDSMVLNLMTNSIKYKASVPDSYLKIYAQTSDTNVILFFEDNGQGIDLEKHGDHLFGMYKTFHNHHDARGVGLFITKNQIESMGGKIEVMSEINKGTTFMIDLPV